jgi:hypothetical protein
MQTIHRQDIHKTPRCTVFEKVKLFSVFCRNQRFTSVLTTTFTDAIVNHKCSVHTILPEDTFYILHVSLPSGRFPILSFQSPAYLKIVLPTPK